MKTELYNTFLIKLEIELYKKLLEYHIIQDFSILNACHSIYFSF